jgi:hypothetical protein
VIDALRTTSAPLRFSTSTRRVEVLVGLAGGALVHGWLTLPASWRVCDLLNTARQPILTLDCAPDTPAARLVLNRSSVAWIATLSPEPRALTQHDQDSIGPQAEHAVIVHVGPFEVHGTIRAQAEVEWSNFLIGRTAPPAEFVPVSDARLVGASVPAASTMAVNVGLIAALIG